MIIAKSLDDLIKKSYNPIILIFISIVSTVMMKINFFSTQGLFMDISFFLIVPWMIYGVLLIIILTSCEILKKISKKEMMKSIPILKIKSFINNQYIEVPKLSPNVISDSEAIASDNTYKYLSEEEERIKKLLIKYISKINFRSNEYFANLEGVILNSISDETSIIELYNILKYIISNSKIHILENDKNEGNSEALMIFYHLITDMSQYNYALDLKKYEARRLSLLKHFEYGKKLIDEFMKELMIKQKGDIGEKNVEKELELYNDYLTYLTNVRFEVDGISIETDGIIVSDKGIFSLEIKNYGKEGDTIIISKDGKAFLINKYKQEKRLDFISQHNRHCGLKQKFINEELGKKGIETDYLMINPIIVIANDKVNIVNESTIRVLRASSVIHEILQVKDKSLSIETQQLVVEIINNNKLALKRYDVINIEKALENTLNNLVLGINYLIEVLMFNETVYNYINESPYIGVNTHKDLYDECNSEGYNVVVGMKNKRGNV